MGTLAVAGLLLGLICIAPLGFVLAGTSGFIRMDLGILLVALPTAGLAVPSFILAHVAWQDLTLARPVLVIDESGIFDRRVTDAPVPWQQVKAATSLLPGRGGVVLELDRPTEGRAHPFRAGTFLFERPEPGLLHIPLISMTVPAARLAGAILELADRNGAEVAEATAHERIRRRTKFI